MSVRHFGLAPGRYITDVQISYDYLIIITGSSAFVYTVKLQDTRRVRTAISAHAMSFIQADGRKLRRLRFLKTDYLRRSFVCVRR